MNTGKNEKNQDIVIPCHNKLVLNEDKLQHNRVIFFVLRP